MFVLSHLRDAVRLIPELFDKEYTTALMSMLNEKYGGRVLPGVGLCIQVYDITEFTDAVLHPGDGASFSTVRFRLVVFRPYANEILKGKIIGSDHEKGVQVSVGIFDNIWVPPRNLRQRATFDAEDQLWTYELEVEDEENEDAAPEIERNYLELNQEVLVQVKSVDFDFTTQPPKAKPEIHLRRPFGAPLPVEKVELPMSIVGSFADDGLGPVEWWPDQDAEQNQEEGEE